MLPQEAADNPDYQYTGYFHLNLKGSIIFQYRFSHPLYPEQRFYKIILFHHSFKVYDFFGQWNKRPLWNDPISPLEDLSIIKSTITFRKKS